MSSRRLALLVPGLEMGGGVPRVARFVKEAAESAGFAVTTFDLAVEWDSPFGIQLTDPSTWTRGSLLHELGPNQFASGSRFSELEFTRYLQTTELRRALRHFDVVQVVAGTPAWALAARGVGRPVALQVATRVRWERHQVSRTEASSLRRLTQPLMTRVVNKLDHRGVCVPQLVFVENQEMRRWATDVRGRNDGVLLQTPGVDLEAFRPRPEGWDPELPLISVGRFGDPRKGVDRLLDCYSNLLAAWPAAPPLNLVGSGTVPSEIERRLSERPFDARVSVRTNVSDRELGELLRSSSLFVATPFEEGLGLAAIEALASGLPAVVTDTAGSRQYVVAGRTGYCLSQSPQEMIAGFVRHVTDILNGGKGFDMSEAARVFAERNFDERVNGDEFGRALSSLANSS